MARERVSAMGLLEGDSVDSMQVGLNEEEYFWAGVYYGPALNGSCILWL